MHQGNALFRRIIIIAQYATARREQGIRGLWVSLYGNTWDWHLENIACKSLQITNVTLDRIQVAAGCAQGQREGEIVALLTETVLPQVHCVFCGQTPYPQNARWMLCIWNSEETRCWIGFGYGHVCKWLSYPPSEWLIEMDSGWLLRRRWRTSFKMFYTWRAC